MMSQAVPAAGAALRIRRLHARVAVLAVAGVLVLGTLAALLVLILSPSLPSVRDRIVANLSSHLGVDASLERVNLSLFPRPELTGTGLSLRLHNQPTLPPLLSIDTFVVGLNPVALLQHRVNVVSLHGLHINVPPGDERPDMPLSSSGDSHVSIGRLDADDSTLTILRRSADKAPLVFSLHHLEIRDAGYDRVMHFTTSLTNPIPLGIVSSTGTIGPWQRDTPDRLPVEGDYTFSNADLNTITGLSGTLSSTGHYSGVLNAISVAGDSTIPDFSLDLGGAPVPLTARFKARVDATDGTTLLDDVQAMLLHSPIHASGAIRNLPGPGRHQISLNIQMAHGRIEDVLRLAVDTPTPLLVGGLSLQAQFFLPPGPAHVRHRLHIQGHFGLDTARFTSTATQSKVRELSRRSRAIDPDDPLGRVMTNLSSDFVLSKAVLSMKNMRFQVPGANVMLAGTYGLDGEQLDLTGNLRMQATVSAAVGGFKSIFIKPFDFLFRKDGAGAVVPIAITGTRKAPKVSVRLRKIF
jgi:hypothetical protein